MAGSVNRVIILGNVGKDPEIRSFPNGGRVANFSVATSESWKDKATGEKKDRTQWHSVSILNDALVGVIEKYVRKGSKIYIEGQIETRKFTDRNGIEKYVTEIVLRPHRGEVVLLGDKRGMTEDDEREYSDTMTAERTDAQPERFDDDIPF